MCPECSLMTARPTVVGTTASIHGAARVVTSGRFRHLPVKGGPGLVGIVDITDICRELDALQAAEEPLPDPQSPGSCIVSLLPAGPMWTVIRSGPQPGGSRKQPARPPRGVLAGPGQSVHPAANAQSEWPPSSLIQPVAGLSA
jgi:hypothetical protein